jgi:hypothetical protein
MLITLKIACLFKSLLHPNPGSWKHDIHGYFKTIIYEFSCTPFNQFASVSREEMAAHSGHVDYDDGPQVVHDNPSLQFAGKTDSGEHDSNVAYPTQTGYVQVPASPESHGVKRVTRSWPFLLAIAIIPALLVGGIAGGTVGGILSSRLAECRNSEPAMLVTR